MTTARPSDRSFVAPFVRAGARGLGRGGASLEQRARILSAAELLVCERGAEHVTVSAVCAAGGVSRAAFYASFEDRRQCLLAVFNEASARAGGAMALAYRAGESWIDAVRGALLELLAFLDDEPRLARFLVVDSLAADAKLRARRGEVLAALARALEAGRPPLANGSLPASFGGEAVVGAVASVLHGRLLEEPVPALGELSGSLMSMIAVSYLDATAARGEVSRALPVASDELTRGKGRE